MDDSIDASPILKRNNSIYTERIRRRNKGRALHGERSVEINQTDLTINNSHLNIIPTTKIQQQQIACHDVQDLFQPNSEAYTEADMMDLNNGFLAAQKCSTNLPLSGCAMETHGAKSIVASLLSDFCSSPSYQAEEDLIDDRITAEPYFRFRNHKLRVYHRAKRLPDNLYLDEEDQNSNCSSSDLSVQEDCNGSVLMANTTNFDLNASQHLRQNLQNLSAYYTQKPEEAEDTSALISFTQFNDTANNSVAPEDNLVLSEPNETQMLFENFTLDKMYNSEFSLEFWSFSDYDWFPHEKSQQQESNEIKDLILNNHSIIATSDSEELSTKTKVCDNELNDSNEKQILNVSDILNDDCEFFTNYNTQDIMKSPTTENSAIKKRSYIATSNVIHQNSNPLKSEANDEVQPCTSKLTIKNVLRQKTEHNFVDKKKDYHRLDKNLNNCSKLLVEKYNEYDVEENPFSEWVPINKTAEKTSTNIPIEDEKLDLSNSELKVFCMASHKSILISDDATKIAAQLLKKPKNDNLVSEKDYTAYSKQPVGENNDYNLEENQFSEWVPIIEARNEDTTSKSIEHEKQDLSSSDFKGFRTASNKNIAISDEAAKIAAQLLEKPNVKKNGKLLEDVDNLPEKDYEAYSKLTLEEHNDYDLDENQFSEWVPGIQAAEEATANRTITHDKHDLSSSDFKGFRTASHKNIAISDEAAKIAAQLLEKPNVKKNGKLLEDVDNLPEKDYEAYSKLIVEEHNDYDLQENQFSEWVPVNQAVEKFATTKINEHDKPDLSSSEFKGFRTASHKNILISDEAAKIAAQLLEKPNVKKNGKLLEDVDNLPEKDYEAYSKLIVEEHNDYDLQENQFSEWVPVNQAVEKVATNKINEHDKPDLSSSEFKGFRTASHKNILISDEAAKIAAQLLEKPNVKKNGKLLDVDNLPEKDFGAYSKLTVEEHSDHDLQENQFSEWVPVNQAVEKVATTKINEHDKSDLSSSEFKGFRTASHKNILISDEAAKIAAQLLEKPNVKKNGKLLEDVDNLPEKDFDAYSKLTVEEHKDYDLDENQFSEWVPLNQAAEEVATNTINEYNKTDSSSFEFKGFRTTSHENIVIGNETAKIAAKLLKKPNVKKNGKVLEDVDNLSGKDYEAYSKLTVEYRNDDELKENQFSEWVPGNQAAEEATTNRKIKHDKQDLSSSEFKGFQTASHKNISISVKAAKIAAQLLKKPNMKKNNDLVLDDEDAMLQKDFDAYSKLCNKTTNDKGLKKQTNERNEQKSQNILNNEENNLHAKTPKNSNLIIEQSLNSNKRKLEESNLTETPVNASKLRRSHMHIDVNTPVSSITHIQVRHSISELSNPTSLLKSTIKSRRKLSLSKQGKSKSAQNNENGNKLNNEQNETSSSTVDNGKMPNMLFDPSHLNASTPQQMTNNNNKLSKSKYLSPQERIERISFYGDPPPLSPIQRPTSSSRRKPRLGLSRSHSITKK